MFPLVLVEKTATVGYHSGATCTSRTIIEPTDLEAIRKNDIFLYSYVFFFHPKIPQKNKIKYIVWKTPPAKVYRAGPRINGSLGKKFPKSNNKSSWPFKETFCPVQPVSAGCYVCEWKFLSFTNRHNRVNANHFTLLDNPICWVGTERKTNKLTILSQQK